MGCEYLIRLDEEDDEVSKNVLEEMLKRLPDYYGRVQYPQNEAFEFRSADNLDPREMPDAYVVGSGRSIVICQCGDYSIMAQALGTIVAEFVSAARRERVEVVKP